MKIKKVLNNNAVISHNEKGEEIVILGSGIAFRKKSGDQIILRDVDKVFYLKKSSNRNKFYELISSIPIKYIKKAIHFFIVKYDLDLIEVIKRFRKKYPTKISVIF